MSRCVWCGKPFVHPHLPLCQCGPYGPLVGAPEPKSMPWERVCSHFKNNQKFLTCDETCPHCGVRRSDCVEKPEATIRVLDPTPNARNAMDILEERATTDDKIKAVIILEMHEDGGRMVTTSLMSMEEKCMLKCFFDSYITRWFDDTEVLIDT